MKFTFKEAQIIVDALNRARMWISITEKDHYSQIEYSNLINKFEKQIIGKIKKVKK